MKKCAVSIMNYHPYVSKCEDCSIVNGVLRCKCLSINGPRHKTMVRSKELFIDQCPVGSVVDVDTYGNLFCNDIQDGPYLHQCYGCKMDQFGNLHGCVCVDDHFAIGKDYQHPPPLYQANQCKVIEYRHGKLYCVKR